MKEIFIYKITSPSGKIYVGKTQNVEKRIRQYIKYASKITQPKLQYSILKYGWDNHKFEIIEVCNNENSNEREIYWISELQSFHNLNKNGMNLTKGGDGGGGIGNFENPRKRVEQRTLQGALIKIWDIGVMGAARELGVHNQPIYQCIKGVQISSYGYVWCYEGEFKGIRKSKTGSLEHRKNMSESGKKRYGDGFKSPYLWLIGKRNHQSKPVFCNELNMEFESIRLAAIYLIENILEFKGRTIEAVTYHVTKTFSRKTSNYNFKKI